MGKILGNFIKNTTDILQNFTGLLSATLSNIISFDFLDTSGRVSTAFEELQLSVDNWGTGFEDAIKLITTPLTEGIASGEDAPSTGTQNTDEGAYERGAPYSGSGGSTTTYSSTGGQKLTDPGGKDYGYYAPGADGSRGSARVHGTGGQKGHTGEDYAMPTGTALTMIAPGTVVAAVKGDRYNGGYGEFVVIQLDDGRYVKLAHLDSINVKKGDKVGAGTGPNGTAKVIGRSGETGLGSGPHLHLDVAKSYDSNSYMVSGTMDPKSFIDGGGLVKGGNVKATGEVKQSNSPTSQPQQPLVGTSPSSSSGGTVSPQEVYSYLKSKGMSDNQALGITANIKGESEFRIGISEDGGPGVGLFQYSDDDRKPRFLKAVPNYRKNWKGQIDYAINEDRSPEYLKKQFSSPEEAAYWWMDKWERPAKENYTKRNKKHNDFIKSFKPGASKPTQTLQQSSPTTTKSEITQITPQAQITPTGTPQNQQVNQSLTPERKGQTVIIAQNPPQPQQQTTPYGGGGGSSGGGSSPQTNEFTLLNIFMKNKLLLDLAYL
jgi:murein DD-endopeptidase MepM/ murein hydrolase activator NlpD